MHNPSTNEQELIEAFERGRKAGIAEAKSEGMARDQDETKVVAAVASGWAPSALLDALGNNPEMLRDLEFFDGREGTGWHWYDRRGAPDHAGWTLAETFDAAIASLHAALPNNVHDPRGGKAL